MRKKPFAVALLFCSVAAGQQTVRIGQAAVELTGPWKFHAGDNMAWAQPDFDDSGWGTMDLTPPQESTNPILGSSGFVPGWTERGYAGYSGYAWYRLRVSIENASSNPAAAALALKMPAVDDAYQVYVNGQLAGEFGRFSGGVSAYNSQPRAFRLPGDIRGEVTIAIRMWMDAATPLFTPDAGGLHGPPVLGQDSVIEALLRLDWDTIDHAEAGAILEITILLLALLVAFALFWLDRSEPAYLWLGLACLAILLYPVVLVLGYYTTWITNNSENILLDVLLTPLGAGLWVLFWGYWFRLGRMARLHLAVWGLVLLWATGVAMLRWPLYGSVVPVHAIAWLSPLTLALKLLSGALLVWVTYRGIRRERAEGWLALPAVLLVIVSLYQDELTVLHVRTTFFPFGFQTSSRLIATVLSLLIITVLLLRRFLHAQREREQWRLEIEQARQVQQVLIPEAIPAIPGFSVESEYCPAQQVGGDFFQILPAKDDSLLIVAGDVSGKGLKPAMLVALIVGTIRTQAASNSHPSAMLAVLNERLCGRSTGGFATCIAMHIDANGRLNIANAGHLPPYLNGSELPLEGSLPLGIQTDIEYASSAFEIESGDRLTLFSDGVVEATNGNRELFGFDRARALSMQPALAIAEAAKQFGQRDDITVITIQRVPVPAYAYGRVRVDSPQ